MTRYDPQTVGAKHVSPLDPLEANVSPQHHRRSIRLKGYDYTRPGAYSVTIVTQGRASLFGEVVDGAMRLNDAGHVAEQCWHAIPDHFPYVRLDEFVIMPNHVHGILWIVESAAMVGAKNFSPLPPSPSPSPLPPSPGESPGRDESRPRGTSKTIGSVVRGFKIGVTKWMRENGVYGPVWQRNYYEHILRDEDALNRIRAYLLTNPLRWALDRENPARTGTDQFDTWLEGLEPAPPLRSQEVKR